MTDEHPLLAAIRAAVSDNGAHSHHWGELRREVFADTSWMGLKTWCANNTIACELAYSESSRSAHVQFRRLTRTELAA